MTECHNPMMQDVLPDYLTGALSAGERAEVDAHLVLCAACSADLAILREVRALRPRAVALDLSRIAASLPKPAAVAPVRPPLVLMSSVATDAPAAAPRPAAPARRWSRSVWQIAAAVGVMVVGGTSIIMSRNTPVSITDSARSDEARIGAVAESLVSAPTLAVAEGPDTATPANVPSSTAVSRPVLVSYGDLGDYTDDELQRVLDRLDKWDGTSSTEPLPSFPVVSGAGGSL